MKRFIIFIITMLLFPKHTTLEPISPTMPDTTNTITIETTVPINVEKELEETEIIQEIPQKPIINKKGEKKLQVYNSDYIIPQDLSDTIYQIIQNNSELKIGIYAISLKDYTCIGYNESYDIDTASSVKAPFCLYVMKEIANGNHTIDETMTYEKKHYHEGSGEIQYSAFGTNYTIEELLIKCINCSDNIAYLMLQDYFGHEGYNEMISSFGCNTWLTEYAKWGKFTAEELAIIWHEIYEFSKASKEGEFLLELLINAKYNFIKDGLNKYSKVAHKSGFSGKAYNDAAIIFAESNLDSSLNAPNDYILVIMTSPGFTAYNSGCLNQLAKTMDLIMRDLALTQNE